MTLRIIHTFIDITVYKVTSIGKFVEWPHFHVGLKCSHLVILWTNSQGLALFKITYYIGDNLTLFWSCRYWW